MNIFYKNINFLITEKGAVMKKIDKELKFKPNRLSNVLNGRGKLTVKEHVQLAGYFRYPLKVLLEVDLEEDEELYNKDFTKVEEPCSEYSTLRLLDIFEINLEELPPRVQFYVVSLRIEVAHLRRSLEEKNRTIEAQGKALDAQTELLRNGRE